MPDSSSSSTLLTYAVSTNPDPIQASPQSGAPSTATLTIAVSNNTHSLINCTSISFGFVSGTNAKDFFSDSTGIGTYASAGWNIKQAGALFTATPDTPADGEIGPDGLTFILSNIKVNEQPGTTPMTITEVTSGGTGTQVVPLAKFPPQFTVGDLTANPLNVGPGDSTTLSWSGSGGATYTIEYADVVISHPVNEPNQPLPPSGTYTINNVTDNPTVFTLIVTYQAAGMDEPVVIQRQCSVAVVEAEITQFNAFPLTLGKGAPCHLSWQTNGDQCFLDPGDQQVAAPNGSTVMTFDETTNLTLKAITGSTMTQDTRTVTIEPPVIHGFTATPAGPIAAGAAVTLAWDTQYASSVTLTPGPGTVESSGSVVVNPENNTTYTLTCTGLGPDVVQQVTVNVNSVAITSFTVSPTQVDPGVAATLSWATENATSASIDNGVGTVALPNGTESVTPNPQTDTTYTLTCEGPNGPVTAQTTLGVNSVKLSASTSYQGIDNAGYDSAYYILSWSTENATSVQLYDSLHNTTTPVGVNGSITAYTHQTGYTAYVLTAWGPGESPVTVTVNCPGAIPVVD